MALIKKFEDILAWQEARKLNKMIYDITQSGALSKDFGLRDQFQRASVSVMTNIAEGFDCESNVEFARFLELPVAHRLKSNPCFTQHSTLAILMSKP